MLHFGHQFLQGFCQWARIEIRKRYWGARHLIERYMQMAEHRCTGIEQRLINELFQDCFHIVIGLLTDILPSYQIEVLTLELVFQPHAVILCGGFYAFA